MPAEYDSRRQTEERINQIKAEERELINAISKHDGTMKEKIIRWAEIMEERLNLGDETCHYLVHQISTEITRVLRSIECKIADTVPQYLPDKYKDPNYAKWGKLRWHVDQVISTVELSQPIEQCSNSDLATLLEAEKQAKNKADDFVTEAKKVVSVHENRIWDIRREAMKRGMKKLMDEEYRDPISERDYRYEIPDYFGLKELNEEVTLQGNREIAALSKFYNEKYPECPATERQAAWKYANAIRVHANLIETINEDKWSGDKTFWFDREFWKEVQSAHKSGNSTMFPTTLCARCSSNVQEDPKDFHRMKYWRPSPTGYICDNCGGFDYLPRENSREQVGDKQQDVYRDAIDVINHMKNYPDVYLDWRTRFKNPGIYARKSAISEEFSKASFGKEKIVVPPKKEAN